MHERSVTRHIITLQAHETHGLTQGGDDSLI